MMHGHTYIKFGSHVWNLNIYMPLAAVQLQGWDLNSSINQVCRSQLPSGLMRGSAAACLLELRVRIPPGTSVFVSCEFCVLSGRGLCVGPITYPEKSY